VRRWNAQQLRLVTLTMVGINVAVYLWGLTQTTGGFAGRSRQALEWGLFGPAVADGEWYRLITSGFVHANALHLLMNMFVIWVVGRELEPLLGRVRFGLLYMASLLAGSAGALLMNPNALTVGASGAAFGLMGALAVGMRLRGIDIWRTGVGTVLVINLLFTFAVPGISIGGHLGGLVGGLVAGWFLLQVRRPGVSAPLVDLLAPIAVMAAAIGLAWYAVA
jgi:membrane associated rhomboid family serine protease